MPPATHSIANVPYRVFFVHREFASKKTEVAAKFVRASLNGWQEYLRDPAPAHALILKLNPAQMQFTLQTP